MASTTDKKPKAADHPRMDEQPPDFMHLFCNLALEQRAVVDERELLAPYVAVVMAELEKIAAG